jgi:general secretion pathway protein H
VSARLPRDAGLTLVEVMVALAIIGVVSGVAVLGLGLGGGSSASIEAEARRLASRLRLAADEAMVTSSPLALDWDDRSYGFVDWSPAARTWTPSKIAVLGARHDLARGVRLEAARAEGPSLIAIDGLGPPILVELKSGAATWRVAFDGLNVAATPAGR